MIAANQILVSKTSNQQYKVDCELGTGGFGVVYLVEHIPSNIK